MTATVLLVRHGAHDHLGRVLCGRMDGVPLNTSGHAQAQLLAETLPRPDHVFASPRLRALQTAAPIAAFFGLAFQTEPALDEIAMGTWTGSSFADLSADPRWADWNANRLHHRPPGGESMLEAQQRAAAWLERLARDPTDPVVVAVSHADLIKAACCHALGMSVDCHARFEIDPASVTTLVTGSWGMKLLRLNHLAPVPPDQPGA